MRQHLSLQLSGQWLGVGELPDQTELIRQGLWYGGKNNSIRPSQNTISLDVVHPAIKQCLLRCFNDGHAAPHLRPTAQEWLTALKVGLEDLIVCRNSASHYQLFKMVQFRIKRKLLSCDYPNIDRRL